MQKAFIFRCYAQFSPHMANLIRKYSCPPLILFSIFVSLLCSADHALVQQGCFTSIVSFGDPLADTGNLPIAERIENYTDVFGGVFGKLPYGITYFHRDSGRASDGRIVLDFVAQTLGLPLVPPYLAGPDNTCFQKGVNFAVTGATALDADFFAIRKISSPITNDTWRVQNDWFRHLLPTLCQSKSKHACSKYFRSSLVFVGEIGANDYNLGLLNNRSITEIETWIPLVIDKISKTAHFLAGLGAKTLVFPNITPLGCGAIYLTIAGNAAKDDLGCVIFLNRLLSEHNNQLLTEVVRLRKQFPGVTMIYADFYGAVDSIIRNATQLGFTNPFGACCGAGGPFNWNRQAQCGNPGTTVCSDPSKYIDWDGIHYTESVYRIVADGFLRGKFASPSILSACPDSLL